MYQLKAKDSDIKPYPLCLCNILKDFTFNSTKKTWLNGYVHVFSFDHFIIDTMDTSDIHKYLMKIS